MSSDDPPMNFWDDESPKGKMYLSKFAKVITFIITAIVVIFIIILLTVDKDSVQNEAHAVQSIPDVFGNPPSKTSEKEHPEKWTALYEIGMNRSGTILKEDQSEVVFTYGETMPEVATTPLHLTDIEMESGEIVEFIQIGDQDRWKVNLSVSGTHSENNKRSHIIINPLESGLQTSMMIGTDRRKYHIILTSHRGKWIPNVRFQYPSESLKQNIESAKSMMKNDEGNKND